MGATRRAALVLVAPFIVIAGIVGGLFTATESAGIACVYTPGAGSRDLPDTLTQGSAGHLRPDGPDHRSGEWEARELGRDIPRARIQENMDAVARTNNSPHPRNVQLPSRGRIVAIPQVGGLHHRYQRVA
jgi:hypothetical protein